MNESIFVYSCQPQLIQLSLSNCDVHSIDKYTYSIFETVKCMRHAVSTIVLTGNMSINYLSKRPKNQCLHSSEKAL